MDSIWNLLELEPTQDVSAIKRAYAQRTLVCHPEEDPEGFLRLREAYQSALNYAEGETDVSPENQKSTAEPEVGKPEDDGWTLSDKPRQDDGPNPYLEHEATQKFLDLYTSKQRKNSRLWLDYFTSDAFLDIAWDRRFTQLLFEHITQLEGNYPVNREFLVWLCIAYQFNVIRSVYQNPDGSERTQFEFQIHTGAEFDGQGWVFEIATKGPTPKRPRGNEQAMFDSFTEYRRLVHIAEDNIWREQDVGQCSQIIGHYATSYITDKCQQRGDMDYERHPAGLRLLTHFFRRDGLPEELYRIAWQKLDLKTAIMGRAKLLYGPLRELILERMPELAGQPRENFSRLRTDFYAYAVSTFKRNGEDAQATGEDIQKTDYLFARKDFQRALLDRRFVEEEILHTWVSETQCDYYLRKILQFYTEHENAPCAQSVIDRARKMLNCQKIARRLREDREAEPPENTLTLKNGPFFRHWLNTGFYHAQDPETGRWLLEYLNRELPYLPEWSKKFLKVAEDRIIPASMFLTLDADTIETRFHLHYMEFLRHGNPVYRPCLEWERVAGCADTDTFFFLLPITVTTYDEYATVKEELLRRLTDTAAPEEARDILAACLAGQVCSLPLPGEVGQVWESEEDELQEVRSLPPESVLPFELFAEDVDHLYGCSWLEREQVLLLFEQWPNGRRLLKNGQLENIPDAASAVEVAQQLLEDTLTPPRFPIELLVNLPDAVYSQPDFNVVCRDNDAPSDWSKPVELLGEAVTAEKLEELLTRFANDCIERLELSWKTTASVGKEQDYEPQRSLLFMKETGGYVCLYFDDLQAESYALLEKPELYGRENGRIELVPFRQSKLFSKVLHRNFSSIRRRLDMVFRQVSWPNGVKFQAGGIWDYAVNVFHGRHKYNLDKQLLGAFPLARAHNRTDAPFYFSLYPDSAACVDDQGESETLEVGPLDRDHLQQMLVHFLRGGFPKLRLTWGQKEGKRQHIVLLQDGERFLMAWVLEKERTAQFHVADRGTYMDVEGKKYPKDTFQGRMTPTYLIHRGVTPLRNALELLLANVDNPKTITGQFAEYAQEKPVKPRPYETIWLELVGNTLG